MEYCSVMDVKEQDVTT